MKRRELVNLGFPEGVLETAALAVDAAEQAGRDKASIRRELRKLRHDPQAYVSDPIYGGLAVELTARLKSAAPSYDFNNQPSYASWGSDIDPAARQQMRNACRLPVTVAGALMPDAHVGYGLPIGGVLATENAVIPYAVGVDIACRVKMTVFELPAEALLQDPKRFEEAINRSTLFGVGKGWTEPPNHPVMDENWAVSATTRRLKDLAWKQIGTSGSGNHFVEFGEVEFNENPAGVKPGIYVAVVSHSGSRGSGAQICEYYSKLAREMHPNLPKELSYLAWLPMDGVGQEYWAAMELMGKYAHANHEIIHDKIIRNLGAPVVFQIENHHNFAWKETHGGRELIVHRKGATPAGKGVLGYIPGSMTAPGFIVEGLGDSRSLDSASHGAGRCMSRTEARKRSNWTDLKAYLRERGVRLISAGLDEVPQAYKDIESVMQAQSDLVRRFAKFMPRLVKMAPEGERAED